MSDAKSRSPHRAGSVRSDRTVVLFLPDGRTVHVTLHVLGIVDSGAVSDRLVRELMDGRASVTTAADDDVVTTRAWWRISDCATSVQLKVEEGWPVKSGN